MSATLVFIDESGLLMAPLVRRTWAPCGQTPIFDQRTRSREKVSIIAALTLSPKRRRVGLYFALYPNTNVDTQAFVTFLRHLARHLRQPIIIVWDRLPGHRAHAVTALVQNHLRLHAVLFPPYAPELNPVEAVWSWLKQNPLANFAAPDAQTLARSAARHVRKLRRQSYLLKSFLRSTPLFSRLK